MNAELQEKYDNLRKYLRELNSLAVAFSGGADSTFLLKAAHDTLGGNVIAVTASSSMFPRRELEAAEEFCRRENILQVVFAAEEFSVEGFRQNPQNRCYICKRNILQKIINIADNRGIKYVAEGSNLDDDGDYRPGRLAVAELSVKSPLRHAKLKKTDIRELSKELNLPTWNKPSMACLASRIPYGEMISAEKLAKIDRAEQFLRDRGFCHVRVRVHGDNTARLEVNPAEFSRLIRDNERREIVAALKSCGFLYVALDLEGYRVGSMNEVFNSAGVS